MRTKQIAAAGTLIGSLLAASATVTAISVTGTLDFRALIPGVSDALGLDGARVTLLVEPGPALDDDDSGSLANGTLLDGQLETRTLQISGSDSLDGEYQVLDGAPWTRLQRDTGVDRILLGGGQFTLDSQGLTLQLAGVSLEMPLGTLVGPDANGEFGLPGSTGSAGPSPSAGGGGASDPQIVVNDGNGNPVGSYGLAGIEADLGGNDGETPASQESGGDEGNDNGNGNDPGQPQILAGLPPELTSVNQGPDDFPPTGPAQTTAFSTAAQVPVAPVWLLLLGGLAGMRQASRRR